MGILENLLLENLLQCAIILASATFSRQILRCISCYFIVVHTVYTQPTNLKHFPVLCSGCQLEEGDGNLLSTANELVQHLKREL